MTDYEIKAISIFERLKAAKQLKNDAALARALGIKPSKLSVWKLRNYVPYKILTTFCRQNNISLTWLVYGVGEISNDAHSVLPSFPQNTFSVLRRVPLGFPEEIPEEVIEYIRFPGGSHSPYSLIVKCECMSPMIKNGDFVVFDCYAEIKSGDIVVVNDEWGETTLKRYWIKEGESFLVSDNPEYPTLTLTKGYKIIGKVVDAWRRIGL